jgi:hypothetical protein
MKKFTVREKFLSFLILILLIVVGYFGYQLETYGFFDIKYDVPPHDFETPTFEDAIKSAKVIFTCTAEDDEKYIRFRIGRILSKNDDYKFPYKTGEIYGDFSEKKRPNVYYGDGRLVFILEGSVSMRSYTIMNGEIKPYRGDNSHKVMSINEVSELINTYRNR